MGKLGLLLLGLVLGQYPALASSNKTSRERLGLSDQIETISPHVRLFGVNSTFDSQVSTSSEAIFLETNELASDVGPDIDRWTGPDISDREASPAALSLSQSESKRRHEAVSHHRDAPASRYARQTGEHNADRSKQHPEGGDESDPAVQPERLERNSIAEPNSGSVRPLSTQVGFLKRVGIFITVAAIVLGISYLIIAIGLVTPILTRRWYFDALIGYIVAISGVVFWAYVLLPIPH